MLKPKSKKKVEKPEKVEGEVLNNDRNSLDKLLNEAVRIDDLCNDYYVKVVNPDTLHLNSDKTVSYVTDSGEERIVPISPYALTQLGTKIGVPSNYLTKCFNKNRADIAQWNMNEWVKEYKGGLFIREYNGYIRGVLSPKYSVCDLPDVLSVVDEVLESDPNKVKGSDRFKVKGSYISPERFHCRLVNKERIPISGEDLFGGITIDSSDVGRSTLNVQFILWKKVCSNGLIVPQKNFTLFRQKHIGVTAEAFRDNLKESIKAFPDLIEEITQSVRNTRRAGGMFDFRNSTDEHIERLIDNIRKSASLSPVSAEKVVDIMISGKYGYSRWAYINALTEVAQDLTLEKRLDLETYAGRLLAA